MCGCSRSFWFERATDSSGMAITSSKGAVSSKDNPQMKILLRVWFEFIEPDKEDTDCPICIGNIMTNYRQMKGALIELENEYQKLKNL